MSPLLLSFKAGDARLGARHGTTAGLVRVGRLTGVPWRGRTRVLASELERVAAEGLAPDLARPRRAAAQRRRPAADEAKRIRALDLGAL